MAFRISAHRIDPTFLAALPAVLIFSIIVASDMSNSRHGAQHEASLLKADIDEAWLRRISQDVGRREYEATPSSAGLEAPNRAQNLSTTFHSAGIAIAARAPKGASPAWRFDWKTSEIGREGSMCEAAPATPDAAGARVSYRHEGWSEWYVNGPAGIEQGFTIEARPTGEGPLRVVGEVSSKLHSERGEGGSYDFIDGHGTCAIRYGALRAWDANGNTLDSKLVVTGTQLAIVVDDNKAVYPVTIDPLMTSPAWSLEGEALGANFGQIVATAGDVNGDGYSDVIVLVAWLGGQPGWVYVYHGSASGLATTPAWTIHSDLGTASIQSVAAAGDVNGDGYGDVIVGLPDYDNGQTDEGRARVYLGSASGLSTTPSWTVEINQAGAQFGYSVGTAGDVNNDGYADVVVGAINWDDPDVNEGGAFVYLGSSTGLATTPVATLECNKQAAFFGSSVGTAGDVNGDGYADVIVGAPNYTNGQSGEGAVFVYLGSSSGVTTTPVWTKESDQAGASLGNSVATAGDVNGDGYSDIIVGAYQFDNPEANEGRVWVYNGSSSGPATTAAWGVDINQGGLGQSVATVGDVNADGYADVIVGAPNYGNGQLSEGMALVYQGTAAGLPSSASWSIEGNQTGAGLGYSVATAGDVNGDGFSDAVVGIPYWNGGLEGEGGARVF